MEDMILDDPPSSNETDRISQLHQDIIDRILFFLPAKDAARSSILSKKWLHVWDSLPVFSFRSDEIHDKETHSADNYMALIDGYLEKLRHCKVRIKIFQLDLFESCHERHTSRFNEFIELANKNYVKELVIHGLVSGPSMNKPSLPLATFAPTNSFELLELKDSVLRPELLKDEPTFPCLRKLYLCQVKFLRDNMVEDLLANCPLLEEFSLAYCDVERVNLLDHPRLVKVWFVGVGVIRVESKNIKTFYFHHYTTDVKPLELHIANWCNIHELDLCSNFTLEDIQEFVGRTPLLEKLTLRSLISVERLKISSLSLQQLVLYNHKPRVGAKEIEIDAPKLQNYTYFATTEEAAISPVFINTERLEVARLLVQMRRIDNLPADQWFIHLMKHLQSFEYNALGILVECDMTNKDSALENLRQISAPPPVYLDYILVQCYRKSFDFPALLDCCLWIFRPENIHIDSNDWGSNTDFIDLLGEKLIPWEENPQCCRNFRRKCWRHDLEEVKIQKTITENVDRRPILSSSSQQSNQKDKKQLTLYLKWRITGQKKNPH